ncbi:hypothetical protein Q7C_407 [Methylophaga frappieri]|uniref:Uncharacterized protein n=1 Tax=Methylophaga frappieri (strain ATCC BAA-2434 / DSM 25690 / JAM7) TaxID=754477 RepID=I1YF89_METFJ|nr:hypothetical protein Q7C_407 [Methylophaga frappieri]
MILRLFEPICTGTFAAQTGCPGGYCCSVKRKKPVKTGFFDAWYVE